MDTPDRPTSPCDDHIHCATPESAVDVEFQSEKEYKAGREGKGDIEKYERISCTILYGKHFTGGACGTHALDDDENEKCSRVEDDLVVDN